LSTILDKQELRNSFRSIRDNLDIDEKKRIDNSINQKLIDLVCNSDYLNIHVFLPIRSEPNIFPFINYMLEKKLNVVCPKSLPNGIMENYILKSTTELSQGIFGTKFPSNSLKYSKTFDLIVLPGLAYSINNDRLGYGGGYYDRFLSNHQNTLKIAPAYHFQVVESLPIENHDIKMDQVITP
jgi:5-formyltetrahydrofolate cyclo-ligase